MKPFNLGGLVPLYKSMRTHEMGRCKFQYSLNHLTFECLFFIDVEPFELAMGCLEHNIFIKKDILRGFKIASTYIEPEDTFWALVNALKTGTGSHNKFNPFRFFEKQCPSLVVYLATKPNIRPRTPSLPRWRHP